MKVQYVVLGTILLLTIMGGVGVFMSKKSNQPASTAGSKAETVCALPELRVTYQLDPKLQALYNIQVTGHAKADSAGGGIIRVSGKACNNMRGSFMIIGADEQTDRPVIQTLQDGRRVLEAAIASTMMACPDTSDPKLDDAALTKALEAIGASIETTLRS